MLGSKGPLLPCPASTLALSKIKQSPVPARSSLLPGECSHLRLTSLLGILKPQKEVCIVLSYYTKFEKEKVTPTHPTPKYSHTYHFGGFDWASLSCEGCHGDMHTTLCPALVKSISPCCYMNNSHHLHA